MRFNLEGTEVWLSIEALQELHDWNMRQLVLQMIEEGL